MNVPKLIAIDLDGTVLNSMGKISHRTKAAINSVRERGMRVVIVTYRAYRSAKPHAAELGLHVPINGVTGALEKDASDDSVLEEFPLDRVAAREAVDYGLDHGYDICLYIGEHYVATADIVRKYGGGWEKHQWLTTPDLRKAFEHPTLMVRYFGDNRFEQARLDLRHLDLEEVDDMIDDVFELTFMHKGMSKHFALERFAADLGIAREDVMAIGDGALDAGMVGWAGWGVAMANGAQVTRDVANEVTLSNDDDGVAVVLERLLEKK
ncbi:MAG: HAD hydrolase family protein [Candidatus Eremiobacterales bacterium]